MCPTSRSGSAGGWFYKLHWAGLDIVHVDRPKTISGRDMPNLDEPKRVARHQDMRREIKTFNRGLVAVQGPDTRWTDLVDRIRVAFDRLDQLLLCLLARELGRGPAANGRGRLLVRSFHDVWRHGRREQALVQRPDFETFVHGPRDQGLADKL